MARVLGKAQVMRLQIDGVDDSGKAFQSANKRLGKLQRTTGKLNNSMHLLRGGVAAVAGSFALRSWSQAIDTYQRAANRLSLVTTNSQQLAAVQRDLYALAQETRQGFGETVQFYSRMALASDKLGLSQKDLLGVTETVGKLVAISGASAAEASGGLIQFSQGLASGRFQGEELRSVMENIPALARAIADNWKNMDGTIGISLGKLRELAKEGKTTPAAILDALRRAEAETEERYEGMTVTIGQAWVKLANSVERLFAKDSVTGLAMTWMLETLTSISDTLGDIGDYLDSMVEVQTAAGYVAELETELGKVKDRVAELQDYQSLGKSMVGIALSDEEKEELAWLEQRLLALPGMIAHAKNKADADTKKADGGDSGDGGGGSTSEPDKQALENAAERQAALRTAEMAHNEMMAQIKEEARVRELEAGIAADVAKFNREQEKRTQEYESQMAHNEMLAQLAEDERVREAEVYAAAGVAKFEREAAERDADLAAWEEHYAIRLDIAKDFYDAEGRLAAIKDAAMKDSAKASSELLDFLATRSKTAFKVNKAVAIAEAVINTHKGITRALDLPFPVNLAAAAATAARGFISVAKIKATQFGGGGSTSDSGGGATTGTSAGGNITTQTPAAGGFAASAPAAPRPITIELPSGGGLLSTEQLSQLITELSDAAGDGLDIKARVL